jgi:cation:H+ antiporter
MAIMIALFALVIGALILGYGADLFVDGASHMARRFGISTVVIGLTVVAFGTSAPEMAVNVLAAINGNSDIAMGNVVGSNIFNIFIVLGISAVIKPLMVSSQLSKIDIPLMVVTSLLLWWFAFDGSIQKWEGVVLTILIGGYTALQVFLSRREKSKAIIDESNKEFSETSPAWKNIIFLIGSLALLIGGARMFVYGAVEIARVLGMSEQVIGLTIVAAGTSLPELAASVAATLKGELEIAIGNVVGSNIFNILAVLGLSGILSPTDIISDHAMTNIDIPLMILASLMMAPLARFRGKFERPVGILFVLSYAGYVIHLLDRA